MAASGAQFVSRLIRRVDPRRRHSGGTVGQEQRQGPEREVLPCSFGGDSLSGTIWTAAKKHSWRQHGEQFYATGRDTQSRRDRLRQRGRLGEMSYDLFISYSRRDNRQGRIAARRDAVRQPLE